MMKKLLALTFAALLACSALIFAACDNGSETEDPQLSPGFFERLVIPAGEENFVDGLRAFLEGDLECAL